MKCQGPQINRGVSQELQGQNTISSVFLSLKFKKLKAIHALMSSRHSIKSVIDRAPFLEAYIFDCCHHKSGKRCHAF